MRRRHFLIFSVIISVTVLAAWLFISSKHFRTHGESPYLTGEVEAEQARQKVVYRDAKGRQLTEEEIADASGWVDWDRVGSENISFHAMELFRAGMSQFGKGSRTVEEHDANAYKAIELLKQASAEAPAWPTPPHEIARTYLMFFHDTENAERFYRRVDKLAPHGYFDTKVALDCLRRVRSRELDPGIYEVYITDRYWIDSKMKRSLFEKLIKQYPKFPAAWKELAVYRDTDSSKLEAIERGLSENPDDDTKGVLLINKAVIAARQGDRSMALRILGDLALDPESTSFVAALAKVAIRNTLHPSEAGAKMLYYDPNW